jgi:arylsulfatase A-like enzyme
LTLPSAAAGRPNVLFFLVDDLGWADLGCYGSTLHETPHIDKLAASGLRFTDAYTAASICSPTRAAIMTGKHPVRVNITDWIPGRTPPKSSKLSTPQDIHQLPLKEVTIGEAFKERGYATYYTGKWHLGGKGFSPDKQGFDTYYDPHQDSSKGSPGKGKTRRRKHGTLEITDETIKFIKDKGPGNAPFFAYVAYYDVHTPIIPVQDRLAHYQDKVDKLGPAPAPIAEHDGKSRPRQDNAAYATMVEAVDASVGAILKTLDELEIADNTIVVFSSDNGGLCTLGRGPGPTCNLPLRASKGWLYEGGIRVPLIIRAPGQPRSTTNYEVTSMDLYPTLLSLAGLPARPEQHVDGQDFSLIVKGAKVKRTPRPLYWHYPHYHGSSWTPGAAIRDGHWKLVEFYHYGGHELYDLRHDPGELRDLSKSHPEVAAGLLKKLHAWQKDLNAGIPTPR